MAESSPASVSRWRSWLAALWALVALQAVVLTLHLGFTRLPCSWIDPVRLAAGCQGPIAWFVGDEDLEALSSTSQGVLAVTRDREIVRLRRLDDGALLTTITLPPPVTWMDAVVSSDGSVVLLRSSPRQIDVWRVADGARLQPVSDALTISEGVFWAFAVAPDGMTVATGASFEDVVRLWRVSDGQLLRTFPVEDVGTIIFSPDGSLLATTDMTEVQLWRVADGTLLRTLDLKLKLLADDTIYFSPDGQLLAVRGVPDDGDTPQLSEGFSEVVQVWRVADGVLLHSLTSGVEAPGAYVFVTGVAFAPDGTSIAAKFADGPLRLWRTSDGALLRSIVQAPHSGWLAFSDDGQTLLIQGRNGVYRLSP